MVSKHRLKLSKHLQAGQALSVEAHTIVKDTAKGLQDFMVNQTNLPHGMEARLHEATTKEANKCLTSHKILSLVVREIRNEIRTLDSNQDKENLDQKIKATRNLMNKNQN